MGYYDGIGFGALVGHKPKALYVNPGKRDLIIECEDTSFLLRCDGDCCSETWWADLVGVRDFLSGVTITAVEEIDMGEPEDERGRQEYDQAYGVRFKHDKGVFGTIYRNSSNGYYGGSCHISECAEIHPDATKITGDWHA